MANGQIHTFNLFGETMQQLTVNGGLVGQIPAWSSGGAGEPPIYTPNSLAVERDVNGGTGVFFDGNNDIVVVWPTGPHRFSVNIDGTLLPITQDLILLVTLNQWFLETQFGGIVMSGTVFPFSLLGDTLAA